MVGAILLFSVDGVLIADPVTYGPEDDQNYNKVEHTNLHKALRRVQKPLGQNVR